MRLRFVSAGAAQPLVASLAAREGIEAEGAFGAVGAMLERFRAGEACDVVILTRAQVSALAAEGEVLADTATDLGGVPTAIAMREGDAAPDISGADPLRAALAGADALYFPDPLKATAGIHFAKVLDELGIRTEVEDRIRTFPNGATAMRAMAQAPGHPLGCTQATEILATPGIRLVAPLPPAFALETVYTAVVNARASEPAGARRFVATLGGEGARELRVQAGFRPNAARDTGGLRHNR